jgi:hypothetical protein
VTSLGLDFLLQRFRAQRARIVRRSNRNCVVEIERLVVCEVTLLTSSFPLHRAEYDRDAVAIPSDTDNSRRHSGRSQKDFALLNFIDLRSIRIRVQDTPSDAKDRIAPYRRAPSE